MEAEETITTAKPSSIKSLQAAEIVLLHDEEEELEPPCSSKEEGITEKEAAGAEEIIKELKIIQRQNTLTHYLLTASILITLAWQLSEYSIIWKIKQGFNNPLKSITGAFKGIFNTIPHTHDHNQTQVIPPTYLPGLKIPDLPGFDPSHFPGFDTSNDDDDDGND